MRRLFRSVCQRDLRQNSHIGIQVVPQGNADSKAQHILAEKKGKNHFQRNPNLSQYWVTHIFLFDQNRASPVDQGKEWEIFWVIIPCLAWHNSLFTYCVRLRSIWMFLTQEQQRLWAKRMAHSPREDIARNLYEHTCAIACPTSQDLYCLCMSNLSNQRPKLKTKFYMQVYFPERPGALRAFLSEIVPIWNLTLFHYRKSGNTSTSILIGLQVPPETEEAFKAAQEALGNEFDFSELEEGAQQMFDLFISWELRASFTDGFRLIPCAMKPELQVFLFIMQSTLRWNSLRLETYAASFWLYTQAHHSNYQVRSWLEQECEQNCALNGFVCKTA